MNIALTIAGSDSGGGAGIQADLKTFEAHGCFGLSAVTALTAQNTQGVQAIHQVPVRILEAQLEALSEDFNISALKIGMLGNAAAVRTVAAFLRKHVLPKRIPVVLDPVMVATSGDLLLPPAAVSALRDELMPLVTLVTPNVPEAEALLGTHVHSLAQAKAAAEALSQYCPKGYILLKGAHLLEEIDARPDTALAKDILFHAGEYHVFAEPFLRVGTLHGTGCTLSAAITANLANGMPILRAVKQAKIYTTNAILMAPKNVGRGSRPLRHNLSSFS